MSRLPALAALAVLSCAHPAAPARPADGAKAPEVDAQTSALREGTARFAEVPLELDLSGLPENERRALARLVEASRVMDPLFLEQVWAGNPTMLFSLLEDETPRGAARLRAFLLNKGPWSRLDQEAPLFPGVPPRPAGANFYPPGATREELEAWMSALPEAERARAAGYFTTIRRASDGSLQAVPYSLEYQGQLGHAATLLREAAALTEQPTLRRYLELRADAFLSNDYYASDVAWMKLDASIEPTIGPYEVYEDRWFAYKAAFEAFLTVRDDAETQKLARFGAELQGLEDALPIDPAYRNPKLGALAPIRVVNSLFSSGDANRGVQTAAFNLPNDERIAAEYGTKRTMLKNVQEAKFQHVLLPISRVALSAADQGAVSFDAFFTHILMHELMHGLGPSNIQIEGRATTVRQALQELSSPMEEAKADISGLWALQRLVDQGVVEPEIGRTMYTTFLASAFRSIRFGVDSAHGRGVAMQVNYLLDQGGFEVAEDGTFRVVEDRIREGVEALTGELMTLQARGDRQGAKAMLDRLGVVRPEVKRVLDRLTEVPVDIAPRFVTADRLLAEFPRGE